MATPYGFDGGGFGNYGGSAGSMPVMQPPPRPNPGVYGGAAFAPGGGGGMFNLSDLLKNLSGLFGGQNAMRPGQPAPGSGTGTPGGQPGPLDMGGVPMPALPGAPGLDPRTGRVLPPKPAPGSGINPVFGNPSAPLITGNPMNNNQMTSMGRLLGISPMSQRPAQPAQRVRRPPQVGNRGMQPVSPTTAAY